MSLLFVLPFAQSQRDVMSVSMSESTGYSSDLSESEWKLVAQIVPAPKGGGRPPTHERITIVNAIMYREKTGIQWRMMPNDFPPWKTVYGYFNSWTKTGVWKALNAKLVAMCRIQAGREAEPTAMILDSQSVKGTPMTEESGYDAGKKVNGHKRHLAVDVLGLVLVVCVTAASVQDRDGARPVVTQVMAEHPTIAHAWADSAYSSSFQDWAAKEHGLSVEIVSKLEGQKGFKVQPRRWVVERTFGWLNWNRILSKEYDRLIVSSEAHVYLAAVRIMLRRLTAGTA